MKKLTALLMSIALIFSFTACSNGNSNITSADAENTVTVQPTTENSVSAASANTIVVYFSATGNTKEVAEYIADSTGGDIFEIIPAQPYTDADLDWTDDNSRVVYEHENENARNVELISTTVDNWDSYDTVFIGYPIWWGIAAWPVDNFVKDNDFTGKTVIPFCTSSSSELGESVELLAEMAGSGNWTSGKRFSSGTDETAVSEWLESLESVLKSN